HPRLDLPQQLQDHAGLSFRWISLGVVSTIDPPCQRDAASLVHHPHHHHPEPCLQFRLIHHQHHLPLLQNLHHTRCPPRKEGVQRFRLLHKPLQPSALAVRSSSAHPRDLSQLTALCADHCPAKHPHIFPKVTAHPVPCL